VKNQFLSTVSAIALTVLLTACGGQQDFQAAGQAVAGTSASVISTSTLQANAAAAPVDAANAVGGNASAPAAIVVAANMPQPDCAPEGCNSLRIIDGNAEAWRIDAARRAALEARL
jgi:protein-disulfide isomerase